MSEEEKPSVYLETSFVSYVTNRLSSDLIVAAHQKVSRDWWSKRREDFRVFVSASVLEEASAGDPVQSSKRIELLQGLEIISATEEAFELASHFLEKGAVPEKAAEDALHMAIAAVSGVDYLLSWNCKHIANGQVMKAITNIARMYGYEAPTICTPLGLMGDYSYD